MAALLVNYDLNSPGQKHANVLKMIQSFKYYAKLSESSYAIDSSLTPQQIYNKFKPLIDSNDTLWIITLKRPYYGQGSQEVIDWLDASLAH